MDKLETDSNLQFLTINLDSLTTLATQSFLHLKFEGTHNYEATAFFVRPGQLELQKPQIMTTIDEETKSIEFVSSNLVKWVYLGHEAECLKVSDNYFDLVPGKILTYN